MWLNTTSIKQTQHHKIEAIWKIPLEFVDFEEWMKLSPTR